MKTTMIHHKFFRIQLEGKGLELKIARVYEDGELVNNLMGTKNKYTTLPALFATWGEKGYEVATHVLCGDNPNSEHYFTLVYRG